MNSVVYCFWTGPNAMSDQRKRAYEVMVSNIGCKVVLIDETSLGSFLNAEFRLHPSYEYLSYVHRADYLRTCFMHYYGGGYCDIKPVYHSWQASFKELSDSSSYCVGYREVGESGVAIVPEPLYGILRSNWKSLIGNGAYIFKPKTEFTFDWFHTMNDMLNVKHDLLKSHPASHPRDYFGSNGSKYPLAWTELLGNIFHPLCYKYRDRVLQTLSPPDFKNYR